jgi:hypothetical protein
MNPVVLNFAGSSIEAAAESLALRSAYIFFDKVTSAGTTYHDIYFDHYMESPYSIDFKIEIVDDYCTANNAWKDHWNTDLVKKELKSFNKIKHLAPVQIIDKKKLEKYVDECYRIVIAQRRKRLETGGLVHLHKLYENHSELSFYYVDILNPENGSEEFVPMSKILMRQLSSSQRNGDFFCLPWNFFDKEFQKNYSLGGEASTKEALEGDGYGVQCLSLPILNKFTIPEMESTHEKIKSVSSEFMQKLKEWMAMVYAGNPIKERGKWFSKKVFPATASILHWIAEDELLVHLSKVQKSKSYNDIYIGEIRAGVLWDFYRYFKVIPDETWAILQNEMQKKDSVANQRWPFMAVVPVFDDQEKISDQNLADVAAEEREDVAPVKKYISID